jgi:hypothetical protein
MLMKISIGKKSRQCAYVKCDLRNDGIITAFIDQGCFSKKNAKYYRANANRDSIEAFLKQWYIEYNPEFMGKFNLFSF